MLYSKRLKFTLKVAIILGLNVQSQKQIIQWKKVLWGPGPMGTRSNDARSRRASRRMCRLYFDGIMTGPGDRWCVCLHWCLWYHKPRSHLFESNIRKPYHLRHYTIHPEFVFGGMGHNQAERGWTASVNIERFYVLNGAKSHCFLSKIILKIAWNIMRGIIPNDKK
jgi:hypothetical protein